MTKTEIKNELVNAIGSPMASKADLEKALKVGRKKVDQICAGLDFMRAGRKKLFLISDVAARIAAEKSFN